VSSRLLPSLFLKIIATATGGSIIL
jgi:hypothetical protein